MNTYSPLMAPMTKQAARELEWIMRAIQFAYLGDTASFNRVLNAHDGATGAVTYTHNYVEEAAQRYGVPHEEIVATTLAHVHRIISG